MLVIMTSSGGFELLEQLEETEKRLKAGKMGGGCHYLAGQVLSFINLASRVDGS